jgi:hypothetical protein
VANNSPESERSNILCFQPPVTKAGDASCPGRALAGSANAPLAHEGRRLCKAFFAIEDAVLRASLIGLIENIAARDCANLQTNGFY